MIKNNKNSNMLLFNFIDRYFSLLKKNIFSINKKHFIIFKSLKFIWEFLSNLIKVIKI
jgi:hypothetical protein